MTDTYRVFRRKVYRREGGRFVPSPGRKYTLRTGLTREEAIALCAEGPANVALEAGREYRHLAFYEFERE